MGRLAAINGLVYANKSGRDSIKSKMIMSCNPSVAYVKEIRNQLYHASL